MHKEVFLFGNSGHARVIADSITMSPQFRLLGVVAEKDEMSSIANASVVGVDSQLDHLVEKFNCKAGVVGIGDGWVRSQVVERLRAAVPDFEFVSVVHPSAVIAADVVIGDGVVVMGGAVINSGVHVSDHAVVNSAAIVDHDSSVGAFCSVMPGATLGGGVAVGDYSVIGLGASVIHDRIVGKHAVVGAGATVVSDIPENTVAYGNPARVVRERAVGEPFL